MSSLSKKLARKAKLANREGVRRTIRTAERADRGVKRGYMMQYHTNLLTRYTTLQNLSAIFLYAMHRDAGFGARKGKNSRLFRLRDKMQSVFNCIISKNVTIYEIEDFLRSEIELDVHITACDPKANWRRKIEYKALQEMEAAFLMALVDEFGFGKRRLEAAYEYCARLSDELKAGKITYDFIREEIERVMTNGDNRRITSTGFLSGVAM